MDHNNGELLSSVKGVLQTYQGTPITIRQLYYRLVAAGTIPNNINSYKRLVDRLSKWRKDRTLPMDSFIDRTRALIIHDYGWYDHNPRTWLSDDLDRLLNSFITYSLNKWYKQPYRITVAVEKQALEGVFDPICQDLGVNLAVCRGYPSLSFTREIAEYMGKLYEGQEEVDDIILYFGDYDPSGMNIPESIEDNLTNVFDASFQLERIALLEDQVSEMDLIPAPVKTTDSRASKFMSEHGDEVFELDAVDPKDLQEMIREAITGYMSPDAQKKREKDIEEGKQRIAELMDSHNISGMLDQLREVRRKLEGSSP